MRNDTIKVLDNCKLIANMKGFSPDTLLYTVEAMIKGGIRAVEIVPNDTTEEAERDCVIKINGLKKCFGKDLIVGAANVFSERLVKLAKGVGADFISTAVLNPNVLSRANAVDMCVIGGGFTATEINNALSLGADYVKLFPSLINGSADYAKLLAETFKGKKLIASGNISFEDITPLKHAGINYFSIGGSLANVTLANKQEYAIIEREAARYCELLEKLG